MLSESSNNLSCDVFEDQWVYWTSSWESDQAAEFEQWVSEQFEQFGEFEAAKRRQDARIKERWRQASVYELPDLQDGAWTDDESELLELDPHEGELDPYGSMLVEICAVSNEPARLAGLIDFLDRYNPEWLDGEGGMIQAGWRSYGCFFNTGVPELARYVELVSELYDLTGTWVSLDTLLVRSH